MVVLKPRVASVKVSAIDSFAPAQLTFIKLNDAETTISDRLANQMRIVQFSTVNAYVNRRLASSRIVWCMFQMAFRMSCRARVRRQ